MTNNKPTIKKIAELAQVSIGTVDRVLHNRADVSKKTKERVEKIMAELDYVPNAFARNLVLNKIFQIAVLLPEHDKGEYWSAPLQGAKNARKNLKSQGVKINIYTYNQYQKKSFFSVGSQVIKERNDAVITAQVLFEETKVFLEDCTANNIPFVLIGTAENTSRAISHIGQNSIQSGRLAGELISFGQRRTPSYLILDITKAQNPNYNVKHRIRGFYEFFEKKIEEDFLIETYSISQEDTDLFKKIRTKLKSFSKLDGIFVPNSKSYMLKEAISTKGNIRIVGYDVLDKNKALLADGEIDFLINQRPDEQTFKGIEYLYKYLALNQIPPKVVSLPLDIVTREKLMYY